MLPPLTLPFDHYILRSLTTPPLPLVVSQQSVPQGSLCPHASRSHSGTTWGVLTRCVAGWGLRKDIALVSLPE